MTFLCCPVVYSVWNVSPSVCRPNK